jgi:hypothetical protein
MWAIAHNPMIKVTRRGFLQPALVLLVPYPFETADSAFEKLVFYRGFEGIRY